MRKKKHTKKIVGIILIVIVAVCAIMICASEFGSESTAYMSYSEFSQELDEGKIENAVLKPDCIEFKLKEDSTVYSTDNPGYDQFKEKLLLAGVKVTDKSVREDVATAVFDMLFNIIFFGIIIFGVYKVIEYNKKTFKVVKHTGVKFSDIAGMDRMKKDLIYAVEILKNPEEYAKKGIRAPKGIVFEGPPGNGKTLFAKALAEEADVNFIATKGADFQSAMMSIGARKIRMLFKKASKHKPCIIFIDEFDSIGERRNYAGSGIDKENNRIITSMLNEMDGFDSNGDILVIAATNSYNSLDPALIRPGRFDLKYSIGNPDAQTRRELIKIYTVNKQLAENVQEDVLVIAFDNLSCAAIETVLNEAASIAEAARSSEIRMEDIIFAAEKTSTKLNIKKK